MYLDVIEELLPAADLVCCAVAQRGGVALLGLPGRVVRDVARAHEPVELALLAPQPLARCRGPLPLLRR